MDDLEQHPADINNFQANVDHLRAEVQRLEQLLKESNEAARGRIMQAQLNAAAIRAGMIDLDGLKLLDLSTAKANEWGEVERVDEIISDMKRAKPWLFRGGSSSAGANPPPAQPVRCKLATEMTLDEYRMARAELLRRR
jgi:hypothetical protein